jgi:hypothetical protein
MRFHPGAPLRKAAKKARKVVNPGGVMKRPAAGKRKAAKKHAKKHVKPKAPIRVNPGGVMKRVPAPRPSPAAG